MVSVNSLYLHLLLLSYVLCFVLMNTRFAIETGCNSVSILLSLTRSEYIFPCMSTFRQVEGIYTHTYTLHNVLTLQCLATWLFSKRLHQSHIILTWNQIILPKCMLGYTVCGR